MTATSFHKERYGDWAGNPEGFECDPSRCAEEVYCNTSGRFYQCSRRKGHGLEQAFCKQHAKKHPPTPDSRPGEIE